MKEYTIKEIIKYDEENNRLSKDKIGDALNTGFYSLCLVGLVALTTSARLLTDESLYRVIFTIFSVNAATLTIEHAKRLAYTVARKANVENFKEELNKILQSKSIPKREYSIKNIEKHEKSLKREEIKRTILVGVAGIASVLSLGNVAYGAFTENITTMLLNGALFTGSSIALHDQAIKLGNMLAEKAKIVLDKEKHDYYEEANKKEGGLSK